LGDRRRCAVGPHERLELPARLVLRLLLDDGRVTTTLPMMPVWSTWLSTSGPVTDGRTAGVAGIDERPDRHVGDVVLVDAGAGAAGVRDPERASGPDLLFRVEQACRTSTRDGQPPTTSNPRP
jgi:hypothetical protein